MTADHFVLVPPESPVLNGGDWLDLGTTECGNCTNGFVMGLCGPEDCDCNSGRVPVVPSWTCPTCEGSGVNDRMYPRLLDCRTCKGEGVVSQGWLALGAAAQKCPLGRSCWGDSCPSPLHVSTVPASLSELVQVQRVPVVDDICSPPPCAFVDGIGEDCVAVVVWLTDDDEEIPTVLDPDQFSSPPNPGGWVWRIVERVTLSDPITGYGGIACSGCEELAQRFHEAYERLAPSFNYSTRDASAVPWDEVPEHNRRLMVATVAEVVGCDHPLVSLPQQVGWYQADDALVAEIERRKP